MKEKYIVKSERYGRNHIFEKHKDNLYKFFCEEDWMPISIGYDGDYSNIRYIDPEGGPVMYTGWKNDEIEIEEIKVTPSNILFKLKEIAHE